ncbi:hypothetical protein [Pseudomonas sp. PDM27]|uniref:hypothetical protein n=1 Tax=Pseudomonas sp. PDM27 TaxID=2854769 RepID=UPI001C46458C|nr:hypothetical protein [Pseudomonas sp. PDM27]MBV7565386.1 hypothetical protein [Pseudomonas sp. PDM27]
MVSDEVRHTENTPLVLHKSGRAPARPTGANVDIPPPMLARNAFEDRFTGQDDLEQQWSELKAQLQTASLTEQEILAVLRSGILQTNTGQAIADLFADAMLRSIRPLGSRTDNRLKDIVDVVCHLPPGQWQLELGENIGLTSGQNTERVTGFIQSQLDRSTALLNERIANNELLTDSQWGAFKQITKQARTYIRPSGESVLKSALMMLEDACVVRPSPKDAHQQLVKFLDELRKPEQSGRVRWPNRFPIEVEAICNQLKPAEEDKQTWQEWLIDPRWLESPLEPSNSFSTPMNSSEPAQDAKPTTEKSTPLLSTLQAFERNADFYLNVSTKGSSIPEGFAARLLWVCNVLDSFGALRLDSRHIAIGRPASTQDDQTSRGATEDLPASSADLSGHQPDAASHSFEQFAAQLDGVLTRFINSITPWNSAYANELEQVRVLLNEHVYNPTTEALPSDSLWSRMPDMDALGNQLGNWLSAMSGRLLSTGVAVLSRTGDLIERNPLVPAGAFAAYVAISNFYISWLLPANDETAEARQSNSKPDFEPDEAFVVHENTIEGITELLDEQPDFADKVLQRISKSDYLDPGDDPQLIEDIEVLLKQTIHGSADVTYQDYLEEIIQLAAADAHEEFEEFEEYSGGGSTTEHASAQVETDDIHGGVRRKRSLGGSRYIEAKIQVNEKGVYAHASARWLIEAGQHSLNARAPGRSDEEIAPGMTIGQAAESFINALEGLQKVSDPSVFIRTVIKDTIAGSNLPEDIKSTLGYKTKFKVQFRALAVAHGPTEIVNKEFDLAQLFAGQHKKEAAGKSIFISWPDRYTSQFIAQVDGMNLQELYKEQSQEVFSQPGVFDFWKIGKQKELERALKIFLREGKGAAQNMDIAKKFLEGKIKARTISIRDGALSNPDKVSNAVFLHDGSRTGGLFVFLGGNSTVIEHPPELRERTKSIEEFPELRGNLSMRIAVNELLGRDEYDFKYSLGFIDPEKLKPKPIDFLGLFNLPLHFSQKIDGKLPYEPILFGWEDSDVEPIYEELFKRQGDQVKAAIDMLTSTTAERITDAMLNFVSDALAMLSMCTAFIPGPGAVAAGLSMLFGVGSAAATFVRGELEDDPGLAAQHKANALRGAIFELVGPFIGKVTGKAIPKSSYKKIGNEVIERMASSGRVSDDVAKYLPIKPPKNPILEAVKKMPGWVAPVEKDFLEILSKVDRKFISYRTANRFMRLNRGPQVAQKLMDSTGVTYFAGPSKGYMYRGVVMRGDMRPPSEIFKEGFKLRKEYTDIKQINGMQGGFGGDANALGLDGKGISTSAYYEGGKEGAFYYGGKKGGYTYVVDGRDIDGFHMYYNQELATNPGSKHKKKAYEINYPNDIPPEKILGAYDAKRNFIPNPAAIGRSVALSTPKYGSSVKLPMQKAATNSTGITFPLSGERANQ